MVSLHTPIEKGKKVSRKIEKLMKEKVNWRQSCRNRAPFRRYALAHVTASPS